MGQGAAQSAGQRGAVAAGGAGQQPAAAAQSSVRDRAAARSAGWQREAAGGGVEPQRGGAEQRVEVWSSSERWRTANPQTLRTWCSSLKTTTSIQMLRSRLAYLSVQMESFFR